MASWDNSMEMFTGVTSFIFIILKRKSSYTNVYLETDKTSSNCILLFLRAPLLQKHTKNILCLLLYTGRRSQVLIYFFFRVAETIC